MDHITPHTLSSMMQVEHKHDGNVFTPAPDDFNAMHWNINHLTNKLHHVNFCIASYPGTLHVIAIAESWLTPHNCSTYNIPNYSAFHLVRNNCGGGGITIYVHNSVSGVPPKVISEVTTPDLNHFLVIELPSVRVTIAIAYRRPENGKIDKFLEELDSVCLGIPRCLIMGDFNMNQLDQNLNNKLLNLIELHGFGLLNKINKSAFTRIKTGTILDLAATNILNTPSKMSVVHMAVSDHSIIYVSVGLKLKLKQIQTTKMKLNLLEAVRKVEQLCDNSTITCGNELNIALENIVRDSTTTIKIKSDHRIKKPYIDRELILAIRERDVLYTLMNRHPDNVTLANKYLGLKTYIEQESLKRRGLYECERIQNAAGDDRKVWRIYKEVLFNQHDKADSDIMLNGNVITNSVSDCNLVNEHFCTAGDKLATSIISVHGYDTDDIDGLYSEHADNNFAFKNVNSDDVAAAIHALPNKKSTSVDRVPIQLLKIAANKIAPVIALCFNMMVALSAFPPELLKGRLKLIHKSGSLDIDNFRGLTLLPAVSKIFEYLLSLQLSEYFERIKLFNGFQFGFLKKSSCLGAAFQLVTLIKANFRKKYVACVFIDLRRAFDTVDPLRLSLKLKRLGLSDSASTLMLSYLQSRQTATTIGSNTSSFMKINVGVAQGSKLGPLHFITYINDLLSTCIDFIGRLILYADDAVLTYMADTPEQLQQMMQRDIIILHKWLCRNVLTLNIDKTCYMTFGKARHIPDLYLTVDGDVVQRVTTFKYLGLVLDENLSFDKHVEHVKKLVRPFISLMWRNGRFIPIEKRKQIYMAYAHCHLTYMLPIYGDCAQYKMNELQTIQNRCIKAMYRLSRDTPSTYLYSSGLLPISKLAFVERVVNIHKMLNSITKNKFNFATNFDVHGRVTRRGHHLHVLKPNTADNEISALTSVITEYNELSDELKNTTCLKTFKAKLKLSVMDCIDYHVISPFLYVN